MKRASVVSLALLDAGHHVGGRLLRHALELGEASPRRACRGRRACARCPPSTSCSTSLSPRPSMSIARREAKCSSACLRCAGQKSPPVQRATASSSRLRDRRAARAGTSSGMLEPVGLLARARLRDARDLGNHVARAAHDHRVALPDVLAAHLVLVVQRGVHDRRAADEHRLQARHRRDARPCARPGCRCRGARWSLPRRETCAPPPSAARARRSPAWPAAAKRVHLVDHAVDVVRRASGASRRRPRRNSSRPFDAAARSCGPSRPGKPSSSSASRSFACVGGSVEALVRADAVGEEREPALRGEPRIELAQRRRRRRCAGSRTSSRPPPRRAC